MYSSNSLGLEKWNVYFKIQSMYVIIYCISAQTVPCIFCTQITVFKEQNMNYTQIVRVGWTKPPNPWNWLTEPRLRTTELEETIFHFESVHLKRTLLYNQKWKLVYY